MGPRPPIVVSNTYVKTYQSKVPLNPILNNDYTMRSPSIEFVKLHLRIKVSET